MHCVFIPCAVARIFYVIVDSSERDINVTSLSKISHEVIFRFDFVEASMCISCVITFVTMETKECWCSPLWNNLHSSVRWRRVWNIISTYINEAFGDWEYPRTDLKMCTLVIYIKRMPLQCPYTFPTLCRSFFCLYVKLFDNKWTGVLQRVLKFGGRIEDQPLPRYAVKYKKKSRIGKISIIPWDPLHYSDVIMNAMASPITRLTIVYSTVHSGVDQRKHQSSWGQHGAHLIPVGPRWVPCWANVPRYHGINSLVCVVSTDVETYDSYNRQQQHDGR